jgi:hypothetical protein
MIFKQAGRFNLRIDPFFCWCPRWSQREAVADSVRFSSSSTVAMLTHQNSAQDRMSRVDPNPTVDNGI